MGVVENVSFDKYPKQGNIGQKVKICFLYDSSRTVIGTIVRDDKESPGVMIFELPDRRFILSTECQYSPLMG